MCQPPAWAARVGVWRGTQRALNTCWGSQGGCRGSRQPQESDLGVTNWSPGWVQAPPGGVSLASPTPPRLRSLLLRCLPQARGRTWTPSPAHSVGARGPSVLGREAHTARGFPAGAERSKPQAGSRQEHGFPSHQGRGSRRHRGLGGPRELAPARGQRRAVSVLPEARRESSPHQAVSEAEDEWGAHSLGHLDPSTGRRQDFRSGPPSQHFPQWTEGSDRGGSLTTTPTPSPRAGAFIPVSPECRDTD